MKTKRITRHMVRLYVPIFRRSTDEQLWVYYKYAVSSRIARWNHAVWIRHLAFREIYRRERRRWSNA